MIAIAKTVVTDAENRIVSVSLDYEEWQKIENLLAERESAEEKAPELEIRFTLQVRDIPEEVQREAFKQAKEAYVMELLRSGDISTGRAAELIGMPRVDLLDLMGKYEISVFPDYTVEELEQEVGDARRMLEQWKKRSLFQIQLP